MTTAAVMETDGPPLAAGGPVRGGLVPPDEWPEWVRELADPCSPGPVGQNLRREGEQGWVAPDPSDEELAEWYRLAEAEAALDDPAPVTEPAGLVWRLTPRRLCEGTGFGNRAADKVTPGAVLAGLAEHTWAGGLGGLDDDELGGLILAWHRLGSWAAAGELAGLAELARRREAQVAAGADPHLAEHVGDEVAALLAMTSRGADMQLDFATRLAGLPRTSAALAAGEIDRVKAHAIVQGVCGLTDEHARQVEERVLGRAGTQTSSQLRASLARAVLAVDPGAADRRRERARKQARVECWDEASGTAALSGRDLPPADVLQADARLTATAEAMRRRGWQGTLDQLRALVFTALLLGQSIPITPPTVADIGTRPGDAGPGAGQGDAGPGAGQGDARPGAGQGDARPGVGQGDAGPGIRGSVNLTLPLATWLGTGGQPGEAAGYGPIPAGDARALAGLIAARPGNRWCLTLTDHTGRAIAHGCATTGGGQVRARMPNGQQITITIAPLATGSCDHSDESPHYRPPPRLAHQVRVRQRTCCFPGCTRPAVRCDLDHTVPYDQGGRTCECSLAPLCRRHHRAKQAQGWSLEQPAPGVMVWRLPHGRTYTTRPDPYD